MTTPHAHAVTGRIVRALIAFSLLIVLDQINPLNANHLAHAAAPEINESSSNLTQKTKSINTTENSSQNTNLRADLHQELNALLAENTRINQEKKSLLESDAQKVFWTQCLVGLMTFFMVISLFSFWRLHVKAAFNNSLAELTTGLRQFQDSILSLIDTRQLAHHSVVSSFHSSVIEHNSEPLSATTTSKTSINPNTEQEMSQVKNFVDAWLNVYTPGSSAHDRYLESTKNRPTSPLPWLSMIKGFRQENDQSNFESIRKEIKKLFNINVPSWNDHQDIGQKQIADYPHVLNKILELWHEDHVATYLERLLANSRINGRQGFDITLYENLENLMKLAQEPNRPRSVDQLKQVPLAAFLFVPKKSLSDATNKLASITTTVATAPAELVNISKPLPDAQVPTQKSNLANEYKSEAQTASTPTAPHQLAQLPQLVETAQAASIPASSLTNLASEKSTEVAIQSPARVAQISPPQEDKPALPAYEVRLKLALAYIEIGDSEGACLLLEDVISDAPEEQQTYARKLLKTLEEKIAAH